MFDMNGRKDMVKGEKGGIGEEIEREMKEKGEIVGMKGKREEKMKELDEEMGERILVLKENM